MLIARISRVAFGVFKLMLLAYVVISWLRIPENKWTTMLRRIMEPIMTPVRNFLRAKLPSQLQVLDFSPVVVYLLAEVVRSILISFFY